jgi:type VI secretion system secreted protein Hcp
MFLKMEGVTGEATDPDFKDQIEVASWSWGMQSTISAHTGQAKGRTQYNELLIAKRVDHATATLMNYLRNNKLVEEATLSVRKAGTTQLVYFKIELKKVRVTSIKTESENTDLVEKLTLGFNRVKVVYTPQGTTGAKGGGDGEFEAEAHPVN